MGKHRSPEPPEVPETVEHLGWAVLFVWVLAGLACLTVGFMCCMGFLLS